MPAKSKAQFRLMQMLAHNKKKAKESGMSPSKASEFLTDNINEKSYSQLPEKKEKFKRVKKLFKV